MNSDVDIEKTAQACSDCEQHLAEIARLQAEVARLQNQRAPIASLLPKKSTLLAVGTFLLAFIPNLPLVLLKVSGTPGVDGQWLFYLLWGAAIGATWAQWSFVGIFCTLTEGSITQRVLMYVGLAAMLAAATFLCGLLTDGIDRDVLYVAYAAPFLTVIMILPVLVARVTRRWTIAQRDSQFAARPMLLISYLAVMTVIGIALAAMKFFPWREIANDLGDATPFLLVFGGPLIAVGCLHAWMLARILGVREATPSLWPTWLVVGLIVLVSTLSSLGGFAIFLSVTEQLRWGAAAPLTPLPLSLIVTALLVIIASYYWLRTVDYELRTAMPQRVGRSKALRSCGTNQS